MAIQDTFFLRNPHLHENYVEVPLESGLSECVPHYYHHEHHRIIVYICKLPPIYAFAYLLRMHRKGPKVESWRLFSIPQ